MEKFLQYRKQLITTGIISGVAILLAFFIHFYLSGSLEDTVRYAKQVENETLTIKRQSSDTRNRNEVIARAVRIYNTLPSPKRSTSSLEDTASRIRTARPLIDELRIRYKFSSMNVDFTKVDDVTSEFKDLKNARVYRNAITIDFRGLSDELVFAFIDTLIQRMPGYITLVSLEMNKESDITPAVVKALLTRDPNLPFLVSGKIKLNWWSITEIEKPKGKS